MVKKTKIILGFMMFLQFFVWGAWFVTLGTYLGKTLGFDGAQIGLIYGSTAIGAIISPLFVGIVADRYFSSQYVFSFMHLLGSVFLLAASLVTTFVPLYCLLLAYSLCYMPTLSLANGIGFRHLKDPDREFPMVRVLGTIGWIVAGLTVSFFEFEDNNIPLRIAAGASLILSAYGLFLPNTPPFKIVKSKSFVELLGLDAFSLLRDPSFFVFFVCSVLICIPLAFYYSFTNLFLNELGLEGAAGKMTLGQFSEVIFMVVMPLLFRRMGVKWMLMVGMLAWALRYSLFAFGGVDQATVWMLYLGIALHGICYDFFFVAGQIYADRRATERHKNSVQGLMTLGTYGFGMLFGSMISGWIVNFYTSSNGIRSWEAIWLVPAFMSISVFVIFVFTFADDRGNSLSNCKSAKPG